MFPTEALEAHSMEIPCNLSLDTSIEIYIKFHSSGQEIPCHFCGNFMEISIEILQQFLEMTRNFHGDFLKLHKSSIAILWKLCGRYTAEISTEIP